jgi:hypothetical protein
MEEVPRCLRQPSTSSSWILLGALELRRGYTTDTSGVHHIRFRGALASYTLGSVAVLVVTIAPVAHLVHEADHATSIPGHLFGPG